jgi:hypothetical protein
VVPIVELVPSWSKVGGTITKPIEHCLIFCVAIAAYLSNVKVDALEIKSNCPVASKIITAIPLLQ